MNFLLPPQGIGEGWGGVKNLRLRQGLLSETSDKSNITIMPNICMIGDPNGSGKTTVFPRLLPNFYFENVLNMSMQMRRRNVPIQSRVISTPLAEEL